ncbi:DNA adenine methylase [Paenibacillus polymyxa]|uniref:DNA adenine methylase n=1 Tax=Paenibacillus polymyxa TaxID=1406 RepID=A0A8I1LSD7_PAEPO|nr:MULTISPECIES: DNA adenine methylase [Paenibacillus]KAF6576552.1 DNA adenine methylase [Paenibacillus sp. EKM206P]KAF6591314.1 DNA adenine methylase [Paenibacillus sp. EKM205P]MBM0632003.1 DNA adenine methylase [Paenibacillus polymyxa]
MQGVRSPLIWFGGKSKYAQHIISRFPSHRKYVEPFGGAAHVIAQKPRITHEVYNDIDGLVVNFLLVNRTDPERLRQACESLPYSRQLYERWKREAMPEDEFERAVRFFYLNRSAIGKGNAEEVPQTGWRHSTVSGQSPANGYLSACKLLPDFAERMKGVMIEHTDFRTIIEKYDDPHTLFYVDPPYVGREKYYAGSFTERDHRDLADLLHNVRGKVVLSYYDDQLVKELYPDFTRDPFDAHKQVVGGSGADIDTEEMLLMNFDNRQLTLF